MNNDKTFFVKNPAVKKFSEILVCGALRGKHKKSLKFASRNRIMRTHSRVVFDYLIASHQYFFTSGVKKEK